MKSALCALEGLNRVQFVYPPRKGVEARCRLMKDRVVWLLSGVKRSAAGSEEREGIYEDATVEYLQNIPFRQPHSLSSSHPSE
jgi:hypothetical protein